VGGGDSLHICRVAVNILNKQLWAPDMGWLSSLGVGQRANNSLLKKTAYYKMLHRALDLAGSCEYGNEPSGSIKGREFLD
jgi:hypothetical protein